MTQLPMDFSQLLSAFARPEPLRVWDAAGSRDERGRWVETAPVERDVPPYAIILALGPRDLEFLGEGEASGGGISITTAAELYFTDPANPGGPSGLPGSPGSPGSPGTPGPGGAFAGGLECRQSYVLHQDRRYRVTGSALIHGNANLRIYYALRHIL